jgi:hypothetical protein
MPSLIYRQLAWPIQNRIRWASEIGNPQIAMGYGEGS